MSETIQIPMNEFDWFSALRPTYDAHCSSHGDALVSAPRPLLDNGGLIDPPDASVGVLSACCRIRLADDIPLPGLVGEAIPDLLHGRVLAQARSRHGALLGRIGNRDF